MSGRVRSTIHLIRSTTANWPPTVRTRKPITATNRSRRTTARHIRPANGPRKTAPPSTERSRSSRVDVGLAWAAAKRAAPRSKRAKPTLATDHPDQQSEGHDTGDEDDQGRRERQTGGGVRVQPRTGQGRRPRMAVNLAPDVLRLDPRRQLERGPAAGGQPHRGPGDHHERGRDPDDQHAAARRLWPTATAPGSGHDTTGTGV